jgi:flagellin
VTITIRTTIASQRAQRELEKGTNTLSRVFERLSTGSRINRASDDAAGLAVSASLKTNAKLYTTAVRNINEGINALAIAEGALVALQDITMRQKELAIQAAQGTYSTKQRKALDAEANALVDEYNRIAQTTTYNGRQLLTSNSGFTIQTGITSGAESRLELSFAEGIQRTVGTGNYTSAVSYTSSATFGVESLDLNGDGKLDIIGAPSSTGTHIQVLLGNGDGTFLAAQSYLAGAGPSGQFNDLNGADLNNDGKIDLVMASDGVQVSILMGNGDGSFASPVGLPSSVTRTTQLYDFNNDGTLDIISSQSGVFLTFLGNGNGTFRGPITTASIPTPAMLAVGDIDGDGILDVIGSNGTYQIHKGNGNGTFRYMGQIGGEFAQVYARLADFDHDGDLDLVGANYNLNAGTSISVYLNNGDGSFSAGTTYTTTPGPYTLEVGDLNNDGLLDVVTANPSGQRNILLGNGDGTFAAARSVNALATTSFMVTLGDFNGDDVLDLASSSTVSGISVMLATTEEVATTPYLNLLTKDNALNALSVLEETSARLSTGLASVGTALNRLEVGGRLGEAQALVLENAASRITDADIAQDAALLIKTQILQQLQTSILAQANILPQIALKLLQS